MEVGFCCVLLTGCRTAAEQQQNSGAAAICTRWCGVQALRNVCMIAANCCQSLVVSFCMRGANICRCGKRKAGGGTREPAALLCSGHSSRSGATDGKGSSIAHRPQDRSPSPGTGSQLRQLCKGEGAKREGEVESGRKSEMQTCVNFLTWPARTAQLATAQARREEIRMARYVARDRCDPPPIFTECSIIYMHPFAAGPRRCGVRV